MEKIKNLISNISFEGKIIILIIINLILSGIFDFGLLDIVNYILYLILYPSNYIYRNTIMKFFEMIGFTPSPNEFIKGQPSDSEILSSAVHFFFTIGFYYSILLITSSIIEKIKSISFFKNDNLIEDRNSNAKKD
jgi:hypothetical protein